MHDSYFNLVRSEVTAEYTSAHLVILCTISTLSINAWFASHNMQEHYKSSCKNAGIVLSSHCMQELYPAYTSMQGHCSPHMQGLYSTHVCSACITCRGCTGLMTCRDSTYLLSHVLTVHSSIMQACRDITHHHM